MDSTPRSHVTEEPVQPSAIPDPPGEPGKDVSADNLKPIADYQKWRWFLSFIIGFVGFAIVATCLFVAFCELSEIRFEKEHTELQYRFKAIKIAGHSILGIAAVYFGYQLIRLSERLAIPYWLLQSDRVDMINAMLGVKTPIGAVTKTMKEFIRLAATLGKGDSPRE